MLAVGPCCSSTTEQHSRHTGGLVDGDCLVLLFDTEKDKKSCISYDYTEYTFLFRRLFMAGGFTVWMVEITLICIILQKLWHCLK